MQNVNLKDAQKGAFPVEWKKCVERREIMGGYAYCASGTLFGHGGSPISVQAWVSFLNSDGESGDLYPLRDLSVLVRLLNGSLKTGDPVNVRLCFTDTALEEEVVGMVRPSCLRCPNKHMGYRKKPRKVRKRRRWMGRKAFMSPIWRYTKRDA